MKQVSLGTKWVGAVLLLVSLIGAFKHHDRIKLWNELQEKREVSAHSATAKQLMRNFGFPDQQISLIDKISLSSIQLGTTRPPAAGYVDAIAKDGRTRTLDNLIEVRSWVYAESMLYRWLSLLLIFTGLLMDTYSFLIERRHPAFS